MAPFKYYDMSRSQDHKFSLRLNMVFHAKKHGIRPTARAFDTTPKTVRRWLRRFDQGGRAALGDRSRAPKSCPHKLSAYRERKIVEARNKVPCCGPRRLKLLFDIQASASTIYRILRKHGLIKPRRKKYQRKNDLRQIKAQYNPFQRLQMDVKYLFDIPAYWPQMKDLGLPRYQYTTRDVKTGAIFIDYADELSTTYAILAIERIIHHLGDFPIDLASTIVSTDNGAEFGGNERRLRERGFHAFIERQGITHRFLPPATPNAHADVESSHRFIEDEFFDLESFRSRTDFFRKIATYQSWWNFARPNFSKGTRTPAQILEQTDLDPRVLLLPPADLDQLFRHRYLPYQKGSHLPKLSGLASGISEAPGRDHRRP